MAHRKRTQTQYNAIQMKCQDEARSIVDKYLKKEHLPYSTFDDIYVVWFAFISKGWKCMVSSYTYTDQFFEVTKDEYTGEYYCNCFKRVRYITHPSTHFKDALETDLV